MRVERGEVFGFLGPNGAGKTTAVKLCLGMARPTAGSGQVLGAPLGDIEARRAIGYLPELFRYQQWLSAAEVLRVHCELAGLARREWPATVERTLEQVGLTERAADRVGTFSKGMQQRLGLGVALIGRPQLVFLDEPTSALDPVGRLDVRRIIGELRSEGVTVFLNSHLLTEVERVCDRVAIVDRGRVLAQLRLADLTSDRTVRIRVSGLAEADVPGHASPDGNDWRVVEDVAPDDVPAMVADLVRRGGQVHAVVPGAVSLEERFIGLLGSGG
ncbi:MAG: ABC transporter ATP-binding protein [Chloroflexi bacterium]|nr:ABC transporter ATP-binding protein [Chloroflexota bacterium]